MDNSKPKEAFIFMKVGDYGGECLEEILERKNRELREGGKDFLGLRRDVFYSSSPQKQVQPFVERWVKKQDSIEVLMERTKLQPKWP